MRIMNPIKLPKVKKNCYIEELPREGLGRKKSEN